MQLHNFAWLDKKEIERINDAMMKTEESLTDGKECAKLLCRSYCWDFSWAVESQKRANSNSNARDSMGRQTGTTGTRIRMALRNNTPQLQ